MLQEQVALAACPAVVASSAGGVATTPRKRAQLWQGRSGQRGRQQTRHPAATTAAGRKFQLALISTSNCLPVARQAGMAQRHHSNRSSSAYVAVFRLFLCARARLTFSVSPGSTKMRCSSQRSPTLVSFFATPCPARRRGSEVSHRRWNRPGGETPCPRGRLCRPRTRTSAPPDAEVSLLLCAHIIDAEHITACVC